jgi:hypothetical protein
MAGYPNMYDTYYGAGYGYAYDVSDAGEVGVPGGDNQHTHFLVWLIVITLSAVAILGGLKVYGFHFVVRT